MKNILFNMSVIFLLFVMVVMNTGETASARSVYKHKIFSKSVVSKRIDTIKQFYYKKSKQLKTKNQTVTLNFEKGKMTYYFHGNDLMFSYGKIKGKEYRAYYLKKQLIQLLVDKSHLALGIPRRLQFWRTVRIPTGHKARRKTDRS